MANVCNCTKSVKPKFKDSIIASLFPEIMKIISLVQHKKELTV